VLAVEARGLSKTYRGGRAALRGVDLEVAPGSIFGLIGQNGAGKTTFIKALLAVLRPSDGSIRVFGEDPERPEVRRRIGYLPERLYFSPGQTGVRFLQSVGRLRGVAGSTLEAEVRRQLDRVGLRDAGATRVHRYSKGMKQRLGLAGALLGAPDLLVLDEPTDGIDPLGRADVRALLLEERRRGATIFLNSHLLAETERVADRVGILHDGRMIKVGSVQDLAGPASAWILRFEAPADAGDMSEALTALGLRARGAGAWALSGSAAELNQAIDALRARGLVITEVGAEQADLEAVLREVAGR